MHRCTRCIRTPARPVPQRPNTWPRSGRTPYRNMLRGLCVYLPNAVSDRAFHTYTRYLGSISKRVRKPVGMQSPRFSCEKRGLARCLGCRRAGCRHACCGGPTGARARRPWPTRSGCPNVGPGPSAGASLAPARPRPARVVTSSPGPSAARRLPRPTRGATSAPARPRRHVVPRPARGHVACPDPPRRPRRTHPRARRRPRCARVATSSPARPRRHVVPRPVPGPSARPRAPARPQPRLQLYARSCKAITRMPSASSAPERASRSASSAATNAFAAERAVTQVTPRRTASVRSVYPSPRDPWP